MVTVCRPVRWSAACRILYELALSTNETDDRCGYRMSSCPMQCSVRDLGRLGIQEMNHMTGRAKKKNCHVCKEKELTKVFCDASLSGLPVTSGNAQFVQDPELYWVSLGESQRIGQRFIVLLMAVFHSTNLMVLIVAIFEEIALRNSLYLREQIYFLRYVISILLYKSGDLSKNTFPYVSNQSWGKKYSVDNA